MSVRAIVVGVSMAALVAGLTACGAATTAGQDRPGTAAVEDRAAGQATQGVVADASAPAVDSSAALTAEFSVQRPDAALITLTNNGNKSVAVKGWPGLVFTNAHEDTVLLPFDRVEVPAPAAALTVPPGASVFAPVTWRSSDKADLDARVADGVAVVPPGLSTAVATKVTALDGAAPGYYEFRLKSVMIGTFQDSTRNIFSF